MKSRSYDYLLFDNIRINASIACNFVGICNFLSLISTYIISKMNDTQIVIVRKFDIPRIFTIACILAMQSSCFFKSVRNDCYILEYQFNNSFSSPVRDCFFVCADIFKLSNKSQTLLIFQRNQFFQRQIQICDHYIRNSCVSTLFISDVKCNYGIIFFDRKHLSTKGVCISN